MLCFFTTHCIITFSASQSMLMSLHECMNLDVLRVFSLEFAMKQVQCLTCTVTPLWVTT